MCNNPCYTVALLVAGPAEFKDAPARTAGGFWRQTLITRHVGSGSKPPRNEPLIYRRAASRGTVSKTIEDRISVYPPRCPPAAKAFYILGRRRARDIFPERER
ncbi:hypothetical protein T03_17343 [Trichinella britovi]|uniref:Uncharacterized protein n=1 Tax=Trichinella britovi TaxID=45882 RepID=A0A0V1DJS5_TRIBR|nr:hypothetical protein T03_17343 [Trichinella britovi]